jgi:FAD:protein FMN transferase
MVGARRRHDRDRGVRFRRGRNHPREHRRRRRFDDDGYGDLGPDYRYVQLEQHGDHDNPHDRAGSGGEPGDLFRVGDHRRRVGRLQVIATADDRALGAGVRLVVTHEQRLASAKAAVDAVLRAIDEACSRFRPDSELSRVHQAAETEVGIGPLLAQAVEVALRAAEQTGGAVDPTVGRAIRIAGYDRDYDLLPADGGPLVLKATPVPGWRSVRLDSKRRRLWIPRGVELDLGATAKALAADLATRAAFEAAECGVLVSLGGDISVFGEPPEGGWRIQVGEDSSAPISDGEETISIRDGGLATSSTTVRRWTRAGVTLHHILDPKTGLPVVSPWRTATVAAATCVDANTASTAAIVLGELAPAWLEAHRLPARLVDQQGGVVKVAGWPGDIIR